MKKILFTLLTLILLASSANAQGRKRVIDPDNLPQPAMELIQKHWPSCAIDFAYVNGKEYEIAGGNSTGGKIGRQTLYFDASDLSGAVVRENLGDVEVFITNREAYDGSGIITVTENLGRVTLHIPAEWNVVTQSSENLGNVNIPQRDVEGDKAVTLVITQNLGNIRVIFD